VEERVEGERVEGERVEGGRVEGGRVEGEVVVVGGISADQAHAGKTKLADITATSVKIARARVRSDRVGGRRRSCRDSSMTTPPGTRPGRARTMAQDSAQRREGEPRNVRKERLEHVSRREP
jgi:hypothetical protein